MRLKQTIRRSRSLVRKTIQNLKSFFGSYQKLPKSFSFNSFSCGSRKLKNCKTDRIYTDLYEEWEAQLDEISKRENRAVVAPEDPSIKEEENSCNGSFKPEPNSKKKQKSGSSNQRKGKESNSRSVLAQKMKELEMMEAGDMEQSLDIEEAIHYYSRLRSPVYLDIVDKFFVDMYTDLSVPRPSSKINNSKRRLSSFRL